MTLFSELEKAVTLLNKYAGSWAICGGVAASIYRKIPRFTADIDFALIDSTDLSAEDLAKKITAELGYKEYLGFIPSDKKPHSQMLGLICARNDQQEQFIGLDFLLPVQNWVVEAVTLAQENFLDYGFTHLPTVTPECLILSKLTALSTNPQRMYDLDDIKQILEAVEIDRKFLRERIKNYGLVLNEELNAIV